MQALALTFTLMELKMYPELSSETKIGQLVKWSSVSQEYVGVLKEWDNGTAILVLNDGTEKAVRVN